jgi:hypothetical protein
MSLRKDNFPTILLLMQPFMATESVPTISQFIEEVLNFKGFIAECIANENEALEGHTKAQQFKFFVDFSGCSMIQYMINCTDNDWLPKKIGGITLW